MPIVSTRCSRTVVLVHPPQARACEPPPGLLVLAEHLRADGVATQVFDVNLAVQEQLLGAGSLTQDLERLRADSAPAAAITSATRCLRRTPGAMAALRREDTYCRTGSYRAATNIVLEGYRTASRSRGVRISPSNLELPALSPLSGHDLLRVYRQPTHCGLAAELENQCRQLLETDPGVVGISTSYLSQALPAAALASLLRRHGYRGTLVLGGGVVTSWLPRLARESLVFQIWDALVAGPGEAALLALVRGQQVREAPGLLAPGLSAWNPPSPRAACRVETRPRLTGLPWERYLAPGPILPLATCRGCYWRRCTYCPETAQDSQAFRPARAREIAEYMLWARDEQGIRHVHLTDDAVPPGTLRRLARLLRDQGVSWYGFVRPEPTLRDPALAENLARGGCAMLQLGIESASQAVLDSLGKGTRADDAGPILANLTGAGIRTYTYLLAGVPGETTTDLQTTSSWAAENAENITFLNLALMNVPRQVAPEGTVASGEELSLYAGMEPGDPLERKTARRALTTLRNDTTIRQILRRTPPGFGSNHAAWVPLEE